MAADPISAIIAALGSILGPAIGAALTPKPNSFTEASNKDIDPRNMLASALGSTNDALSRVTSNMDKGVFFPSSYVQSPPSFSGGGLPMPFGVTGRDSALDFAGQAPGNRGGRNPLLLPGPFSSNGGGKLKGGVTNLPEPPILRPTDNISQPGPDNTNNPSQDSGDVRTGGTLRPFGSGSPQLKVGGDHEQALAAFRMLGLNI